MSKFSLSNKAVFDLSQIWEYTFNKWGLGQADSYYQMIIYNLKQLAFNPDLGKVDSILPQNLFEFRAGRHLIFYRKVEENEIEIVRILHERMDLKIRISEN